MSNFLIGSTYGFLENRHHYHLCRRSALLGKGFGWAFIINILVDTAFGYIPGLIFTQFWVQTRDKPVLTPSSGVNAAFLCYTSEASSVNE